MTPTPLKTVTGFITSQPTETIEPISLPDLVQSWNFSPLSPLHTPSAPDTPTASQDPWMVDDILTGSSPLKRALPLAETLVPSSRDIRSWLAGSTLEPPAKIVKIAPKSAVVDLTKCAVIPVAPRSSSSQSHPRSTCSIASSISRGPLSPRSRLRAWSRRIQTTNLTKHGSEPACQEMVAPPQSTKMTSNNAKSHFGALLLSLGVVNGQEYEDQLKENQQLRELERALQPNHVEGAKKILFRQNYLLRSKKCEQRFGIIKQNTIGHSPSLRGGWLRLLDQVSRRNGIGRLELMLALKHWMTNVNGKRKGLILIGKSDSGKTFLADCLLSGFSTSDIGYFQCPMGNTVSTFMYSNLLNKEIYRCDEFYLENAGVLQSFKQLTEGSSTLQTDVKYKDRTAVDPKPVIVTMNGTCVEDIVKFFSTEFIAIKNRCTLLMMDQPLKQLFTDRQLDQLRAGAQTLVHILLNTEEVVNNENNTSLSEFADYLTYVVSFLKLTYIF